MQKRTPINPNIDPDLPVKERGPDKLPLKSIVLSNFHSPVFFILALVFQAMYNERSFFVGKESCRLGEIVQCEIRNDCDNYSEHSLENEDPAPAFEVADPVHVSDAEG